jgi:hypothetical protein
MKIIKQCYLLSKNSELNADLTAGVRLIMTGGESLVRGFKAVMQSVITSTIKAENVIRFTHLRRY